MVVTTVFVKVKPDLVSAFIKATLTNHENSTVEPGNRRFDILQSDDDPTAFMLYEAYDTAESAAAHRKTPHYAEWRDTVADWMAEPRKGTRYKSIKP
jgi:(4S)-4-hydroxy-5-phosphonooxypentane-2,3-dione isomerase